MHSGSLNTRFDKLTYEEQRLVRVGYNRLKHEYLDEEGYQKLPLKDLENYYRFGKSSEIREKKRNTVVTFVVVLVLAVGLGIYSYNTKKKTESINAHYNSISGADVCTSGLKTLQLFSDDIHLEGILPTNPVTKYPNNSTSTCDLFVKGNMDIGAYTAYINANVEKTHERQQEDTKKDASLLTDTPYNVFTYSGQKDYYKITVRAGIDPKDTNLKQDVSDNVSKLLVLLFGTGIADGLPSNPAATDVP